MPSSGTRSARVFRASSWALPHSPQDEVVSSVLPRRSQSGSIPCRRKTSTMLRSSAFSGFPQSAIEPTSPRPRITPSASSSPAASSSSWPGVRIVTPRARPSIRISSGSSTTILSSVRRGAPSPTGPRGRSCRAPRGSGAAARFLSVLAGSSVRSGPITIAPSGRDPPPRGRDPAGKAKTLLSWMVSGIEFQIGVKSHTMSEMLGADDTMPQTMPTPAVRRAAGDADAGRCPEHRDHRARRPRKDHAGGRPPVAERASSGRARPWPSA